MAWRAVSVWNSYSLCSISAWAGRDARARSQAAAALQAARDALVGSCRPEAYLEYAGALDAVVAAVVPEARAVRALCLGGWRVGDEVCFVTGLRPELVFPRLCAGYTMLLGPAEARAAREWQLLDRGLARACELVAGWANLPRRCPVAHLDVGHMARMRECARLRCALAVCEQLDEEEPAMAAGVARSAHERDPPRAARKSGHPSVRAVADLYERLRAELLALLCLLNATRLKGEGRIHEAAAVMARASDAVARLQGCALAERCVLLAQNLEDRARFEPGAKNPAFTWEWCTPPYDLAL